MGESGGGRGGVGENLKPVPAARAPGKTGLGVACSKPETGREHGASIPAKRFEFEAFVCQ
jgi:hypothetical protein